MWLIVGVTTAFIALVAIAKLRTGGVNAAAIGWMSQQWLDEHRATHSP